MLDTDETVERIGVGSVVAVAADQDIACAATGEVVVASAAVQAVALVVADDGVVAQAADDVLDVCGAAVGSAD